MKRRLFLTSVAAPLAAPLAGCVGTWYDDYPPSVSLVASVGTAAAGQVVRLSAAASDDGYVSYVDFYRIDPDNRTYYLGTDRSEPYLLDVSMPTGFASGSTVYFYATATDDWDNRSDSALVAVRLQ